jgi:hypothetical protein
LLQAAHGGTDAFAPVAAQVFMQDRAQKLRRPASFLTALLEGYDGTGSLEAFMRTCVRHFLADMANARKPLERQARNPRRRALLQGDAPPAEEGGLNSEEGETAEQRLEAAAAKYATADTDGASEGWGEKMERVALWVEATQDQLEPLEQALLRQLMGSDEAVDGKSLASQFGCTPSWVSQCKTRLVVKMRETLRLPEA